MVEEDQEEYGQNSHLINDEEHQQLQQQHFDESFSAQQDSSMH